jgi:hypothetical protein
MYMCVAELKKSLRPDRLSQPTFMIQFCLSFSFFQHMKENCENSPITLLWIRPHETKGKTQLPASWQQCSQGNSNYRIKDCTAILICDIQQRKLKD